MIRLFTIFCKLNQISFSDRQWLEQDLAGFFCPDADCPFCGAKGCMDPFARYSRYLVELRDGKPAVSRVEIPRYRCASCGHTHAVLSAALVPYRSYSLRFILHVLLCYFLHRKTVAALCEAVGISPSTLYDWKKLFLRQKEMWLGTLSNLETPVACFVEDADGELLKGFREAYLFSFLQHMPRTDAEMSPGNPPPETVST